jgi:hypothetical protein
MILNNIILIIVLLLLANYLSKGTIVTIVLKYYEIVKNYIFPFQPKKEEEPTCNFHYNNEDTELINNQTELINNQTELKNTDTDTETENTLKLNTLNLSDSGSISISDMNFSTLV